jgi:hypothetical protein
MVFRQRKTPATCTSTSLPQEFPIIQEVSSPPLITTIISLLHNGQQVQEGLRQTITEAHHKEALKEKLKKDNQWDDYTLSMVAWADFHSALQLIPRSHRVSIAKLSHQLWNTNKQNNRYYGAVDKCPICLTESESIQHVHNCQHKLAVEA